MHCSVVVRNNNNNNNNNNTEEGNIIASVAEPGHFGRSRFEGPALAPAYMKKNKFRKLAGPERTGSATLINCPPEIWRQEGREERKG